MTAKPSKFIWYDLMTSDLKAAEKFYGKVVGWKIADSGMPGMSYSILSTGDVMVGGMMASPAGAGTMGRPAWTGYIFSSDVDADTKRAAKMGGKICREPADIPGVGRFAVIADPHGAMFNLFKPNSDQSPAPVPDATPGHIGWRELHAGDGKTAWDFYCGMFAWTKAQSFDMGALGVYQLFATGGTAVGGMMTRLADTPMPHWLYYFNVDAIDAAAARASKAGGKVIMGPHQVPTGQWIVQCADPQGAEFPMLAAKR
jgi:hypothetical protein